MLVARARRDVLYVAEGVLGIRLRPVDPRHPVRPDLAQVRVARVQVFAVGVVAAVVVVGEVDGLYSTAAWRVGNFFFFRGEEADILMDGIVFSSLFTV